MFVRQRPPENVTVEGDVLLQDFTDSRSALKVVQGLRVLITTDHL